MDRQGHDILYHVVRHNNIDSLMRKLHSGGKIGLENKLVK